MTECEDHPRRKRLSVLDSVLQDPPKVHYMSEDDVRSRQQTGVWSTDRSCYEFLAEHCRPGALTLETGSGVSTVLFAAWLTQHVCVTPGQEEADALVAYCATKGFPTTGLHFEISRSDLILPALSSDPLDLVLIDGNHGFPTPMIDWYYGAGRLRTGGVVVIDDLHLPAVRLMVEYLRMDPRWRPMAGTAKWAGFERLSEVPLGEDWFAQPFYRPGGVRSAVRMRAATILNRVRSR